MPRPTRSPKVAAALAALTALALAACAADESTAPAAATPPAARPSAVVAALTGGTVLHDQSAESVPNRQAVTAYWSHTSTPALLALDFVVPAGETWAVSQVLITGILHTPTLSFAIHADAGGRPGAVLHDYTLPPARSATSPCCSGVTDFLFALATPATLEPGTYWLAVAMGANSTPYLYWHFGSTWGAPLVQASLDGGTSWDWNQSDLAVVLYEGGLPLAQAITLTSAPPSPAAIGGTYTVEATATSGLAVAVGAGPAAVCTVNEGVVSFVGAGDCTVTADQAGDAVNAAAPQVSQTVTVAKAPQTITVTSAPPSPAVVGGAYTVTARGGASGEAVTFSALTPAVCTVAGSTVALVAGGTCTVAADQAGNDDYEAAPQATQSFAVAKLAQAIRVTSAAPVPAYVNGAYAVVAAGGASGNAVVVSAAPAAVCAASGATVTFVGVGTCTVAADQAGDAAYEAAARVTQTVKVDYRFEGFAAPVDNGGALNSAKAGQAIPLKWRLTDAAGAPVTTLTTAIVTVAGLACDLGGDADALEAYATSGSGLQNLGHGYYQLNWRSPSGYARSCKTLKLDLGEGSGPRTANFQFTK